MRFRNGETITVEAECSIDEFDDTVILEAAVAAVRQHRKDVKPDAAGPRLDLWMQRESAVQQLIAALAIPSDDALPPASTAAHITSMDALRAWQKEQRKN